jgi:hypothetical protein
MKIGTLCLAASIALIAASAAAQNTFPASGNVGIGTWSPATALNVVGGDIGLSAGNKLLSTSGSTTNLNYIQLYDGNGGMNFLPYSGVNTPTQGYFNFYPANAASPTLTINSNGGVGIGTGIPSAVLHVEARADGTTGQSNCGTESSACPASAGSGYGIAIDGDYDNGQYRWRLEPVDRGSNVSLYIQQTQGTANSFSNVARFGVNQYDSNSFAVFGNSYLGGNVGVGGAITFPDKSVQSVAWNGVLSGGDYAESVDVTGDRAKYEPGDVLVIDPAYEGHFLKSAEAYSTSVTGIYSTKPGALGRRQKTDKSHMKEEVPMAMTGIVPVKVSVENGRIKPGDLLVTSSRMGYAMKGTDRAQMLGAVIGKSLGHLDEGTGVIEVVVTLQ